MGEFNEADHARDHGKFVSVGGATHVSGASHVAHRASKVATSKAPAGEASAHVHGEHAAAHIDAAAAHLKAADAAHKAAAKEPDPSRKGQHEKVAAGHIGAAVGHAKEGSSAIAKGKEAGVESKLGAWAKNKLGEGKKDGAHGKGEQHPKVLTAAEKFHEGVAHLGEKAKEVAEKMIEGNPLALGKGLVRGAAAVVGAGFHKAVGIKKKEAGGGGEGHGGHGADGLTMHGGEKQERRGGEVEHEKDRERQGGEGGDYYDPEGNDDDIEA